MILTQVFVVMCSVSGPPCADYVHVMVGLLSPAACDAAIQRFAGGNARPGIGTCAATAVPVSR